MCCNKVDCCKIFKKYPAALSTYTLETEAAPCLNFPTNATVYFSTTRPIFQTNISFLALLLMIIAVRTSETSMPIYQTTLCHNSECHSVSLVDSENSRNKTASFCSIL